MPDFERRWDGLLDMLDSPADLAAGMVHHGDEKLAVDLAPLVADLFGELISLVVQRFGLVETASHDLSVDQPGVIFDQHRQIA